MADGQWPADWAERMAGRGCPMCAALGNGDNELDPGQACGYWEEVLAVGRAVRALFDPVKLNYLTLGNTVPHLHTHVVPRYLDDPAPGGPIAWEQIFAPGPVPETDLHRQAADLRALLSR
jgi:diadenosine tetraphosphate (Ap4A) HIT family hydrolase